MLAQRLRRGVLVCVAADKNLTARKELVVQGQGLVVLHCGAVGVLYLVPVRAVIAIKYPKESAGRH